MLTEGLKRRLTTQNIADMLYMDFDSLHLGSHEGRRRVAGVVWFGVFVGLLILAFLV